MTFSMKTLLLTLVLGLVYAESEPQLETEVSPEITGEWYTVYAAASIKEKAEEGGSLLGYVRNITVSDGGNSVSFEFYVKVNGICQIVTYTGEKVADGRYKVDYSGDNSFYFANITDKSISIVVFNTDEEGNRTKMVEVFSKGRTIPKEDYETFVELLNENDIPLENIVNAMDSDDCPGNIN